VKPNLADAEFVMFFGKEVILVSGGAISFTTQMPS
jgi:hypothetical protein